MSLIRICNAPNLNKWDKEPCDLAAIIKEWFNPDRDPDPSVYWASSESEEVEVAASHSLTDLSPNLKPVHLLRIEWSDLVAIGVSERTSNRVPGRTGLVRIDFQHWELVGGKDYLDALVRRSRERYEAREQPFRWVGPPVLRRQLTQFCSLPDHEVIPEAKRRCRHKLHGGPGTLPLPRREELREQLRNARPNIPQQAIRERAFQLYKQSGREDADQNWMDAERELLTLYEAGFVKYEPPPAREP
jgi:hypothetical protein